MNIKKIIGDSGERKAARVYIRNGYKIIARNFSCKYGELDIVAKKDDTIVIVEVKTRNNNNYANARDFVDFHKQKRITKTTDLFLQQNNLSEYIIRFDVVEIYTDDDTINIIENAF